MSKEVVSNDAVPSETNVPERENLLNVVVEGFQAQNSKRVSRMVLVGELTSVEAMTPFMTIHKEFESHHKNALGGVLFIVNRTAFIEVLEAPALLLAELLGELTKQQKEKSVTNSFRILSSIEEVQPMFPTWEMRTKRVPKATHSDFSVENIRQDAFELIKALLLLGVALQRVPESKRVEFLDSKKREVTAAIPSAEVLRFFAQQSKYFFAPDEYMKTFYAPVKLDLASEHVWPVEPFLQF